VIPALSAQCPPDDDCFPARPIRSICEDTGDSPITADQIDGKVVFGSPAWAT
jgi:hypothetical protein